MSASAALTLEQGVARTLPRWSATEHTSVSAANGPDDRGRSRQTCSRLRRFCALRTQWPLGDARAAAAPNWAGAIRLRRTSN